MILILSRLRIRSHLVVIATVFLFYGFPSFSQPTAIRPATSASATTPLPLPAGRFGIGRAGYDLVDKSRTGLSSTDPNGRRELMVYLWYPITVKRGDIRGVYLP